ncbi:MAG: radical SAM protein [Candidatus Omnitrophica bacterium]|nr:radical SAM protein [Candidatus Omnitrophota bacterium]
MNNKFLTWDIHYKCNYYCTYCFLHSEPETTNIESIYLKNDEWVKIWRLAYQKYGPCNISVTGGEPFIYPNFIDLISKLTDMHTFEFSTNLSWDVVEFARKVPPDKVKINSSFHPEFIVLEDFLKKITYLKENNYLVNITIVAYPPLLDSLFQYNEHIKKAGCFFILYPFRGLYENRVYPEGYTDKERAALNKLGLELRAADANINEPLLQKYKLREEYDRGKIKLVNSKTEKICYMGQRYAKLVPNGEAFRCCAAVNKEWGRLGNFIKGTFEFSAEPLICPDLNHCRCYKAMTVGDEEKWKKQWIDTSSIWKIEEEKKSLEKAKHLRDQGDIREGEKEIKELLKINPENVEAMVLLAELKLNQKDYNSCRDILNGITTNYPGSDYESWIYRILGRAFMELGVTGESAKEREVFLDKAGQYLESCLRLANEKNNLADRARGYYESAAFHLLREDYKMAKGNIGLALKYEPENEGFLRLKRRIEEQEIELALKQVNSSGKITFGWDLCYSCNYRCPYCGVWETQSNRDLFLSPEEWSVVWDRIFDNYGSCHIFMSGGEPSVYAGFSELVKRLTSKHSVEICTNLSWDVESLILDIPPGKLRIAPTFHPSQADFGDFFKKAVKAKDYLPNAQVYYVAYSGQQITEMSQRSKMLKEHGIALIPYPLRGNQAILNTEEEERIIREVSPYRGEKIEYQLKKISPKGKLCRAGQRYAVIRGGGAVDRCSQHHNGEVGNFLDKNFSLFDEARPCGKEYCPIESQWIIV